MLWARRVLGPFAGASLSFGWSLQGLGELASLSLSVAGGRALEGGARQVQLAVELEEISKQTDKEGWVAWTAQRHSGWSRGLWHVLEPA